MSPQPPPWAHWLPVLREPAPALQWTLQEWGMVLRLARRLRLLARLAARLQQSGLMEQVPLQPRRHLMSELRVSQWRTTVMGWALTRVAEELGTSGYPLVLLKGAAYIGQGLPIAAGRLPSDVDILVPQAHLADAVRRLEQAGWTGAELDDHDQRYYAEWTHEVAPMSHALHPVELDLHHNILPPVARTRVDAQKLLAHLQPSQWPAWQVLQPLDQVLHSAAHLFLDSELSDRVRDLVDLDGLLRHFGTRPGFWQALPQRALELGLTEPLALACHFTQRWLGTPWPDDALTQVQALGPGSMRRAWLLPVLEAAMTPTAPDATPSRRQGLAALVVLTRYHRQRLPVRLLVPHLWHKMKTRHRAGLRDGAAA